MEIINWYIEYIASIKLAYRGAFAFLSSFFIVLLLGNKYIAFAKKSSRILQPIREDGPETHIKKAGTPTLGGILFMFAFWVSSLFWIKELTNIAKIILIVSFLFSCLGFVDDYLKLAFRNSRGFSGKLRLLIGFIIAVVAMYYLVPEYPPEFSKAIFFPFVNSAFFYFGVGIIIFGAFVVVGTANSVNLTDGLDGLSTLVVFTILVAFLTLMLLIISSGFYSAMLYNSLFYYKQILEVFVLVCALMGALIGFLWFNAAPAKIFMGDVGSLGLGATLGMIAVSIKQELFLGIAGIFLVLETLSVIIQVYYFKITGKRVFLMAPFHHHFEKKGIPETTVVKRIWIFTIITSVFALLLLDI